MSTVLLISEAFIVALFVLYLSFYYGNWKKQHKLVTIVSYIAWYLPILILFIIPIDISVAYFSKCQAEYSQLNHSTNVTNEKCRSPWLFISKEVLLVFWHIVYWTTFCLTWIMLPIIQSYAKSGAFSLIGKFRSALIDNAIYYGTYLLVVVFIGIYLLIKHTIPLNLSSIKLLIIMASNTWGMLWVILFLGYGLVEVPRDLWYRGDNKRALIKAYCSLPHLNIDKLEEEEELEHLICKGKKWSNQLSSGHPYRAYMDIILDKIEEAEGDLIHTSEGRSGSKHNRGARQSGLGSEGDAELDSGGPSDASFKLKTLEGLHRSIKVHRHRYLRAHALWQVTVQQALLMEDVESNLNSGVRHYRHSSATAAATGAGSTSADIGGTSGRAHWLCSKLEWYWRCQLMPLATRTVSCLAILLSALFVWSECTFWVQKPVLSVFAQLLQLSAAYYNYFTVAMVSFFSIGYLSFCVYFTVFRLKLFNYFRLVPNHHSDENSLVFCGMLLCRLTPPLCLNFLSLVHFDSHVLVSTSTSTGSGSSNLSVETAYTSFMGHLDLVPLIARGFNVYFPLLVLVLCLCTLLQLGSRLLRLLGLDLLFGGDNSDDPIASAEEGRTLLRRERQTFEKNSRYLATTADKRPDYRSTVIEMASREYPASNRDAVYRADSARQKLLDDGSPNSDDWTPVEYSEANIDRDFRLATRTANPGMGNARAGSIRTEPANSPSFLRRFWPL